MTNMEKEYRMILKKLDTELTFFRLNALENKLHTGDLRFKFQSKRKQELILEQQALVERCVEIVEEMIQITKAEMKGKPNDL
jgi:hypothetical protein